jgi:hypothetical protein
MTEASDVAPDGDEPSSIEDIPPVRKRQKKSRVEIGMWFAVMLARNRDDGTSPRAERTTIKVTQNISATLATGRQRRPMKMNNGTDTKRRESGTAGTSQWRVVFAIGPVVAEAIANDICTIWMNSQRGVIPKAARGEAITIVYDIPGFVDWDAVLGSTKQLNSLYDVITCRDPCADFVAPQQHTHERV